VRTREIKTRLDTAYMLPAQHGHEEALRIEKQLRQLARVRRKQARQQARALANPDEIIPAAKGGLKRGPKPNPFLVKCEHGLHTQLTEREITAFHALRKTQAPNVTGSTFLRFLICEALEKHRRKDLPTSPFTVDLQAAQDHRRTRTARAREARRAAA